MERGRGGAAAAQVAPHGDECMRDSMEEHRLKSLKGISPMNVNASAGVIGSIIGLEACRRHDEDARDEK